MEPKTCLLLGLLCFRVSRVFRENKWEAEHESKKFKNPHNSSIFLILQSTSPELTSLCLKGWCEKVDDVFVVPRQYVNWNKPTESWNILHFEKMIYHSERLPQQAQWYMFAFDNNYMFIDRFTKELAAFDAHLPIYTVLRDPYAKFVHRPVVVFSRQALNTFYERAPNKCDSKSEIFEEWLESCMSLPPINMSIDKNNKSRIFAFRRHFELFEYENNQQGYHDDKEFIYSHSDSLLSFTNLSEIDLKLLPIFVEKVKWGKRNEAKNHK